VRRELGVPKAWKRTVSKPFFGPGNPFSTFKALYSRHPAGKFLSGTDPLPFATERLRLITVSPSTAESEINRALEWVG